MAQGERSPTGLCILRVADTRHRREVEPRLLSHILQDHRAQRSLIAIYEELVLQLDDGPHGDGQCMATHLDGLDKALGSIHLFLNIEQRFLRLSTQVVFVGLILFHGVYKRL